ncbi:MAG: hypothetical protein ABWW69_03740, partial [Pyrodictiaceae archaeon]
NVRKILGMDPGKAEKLVGKTTVTAYRRLHEIIGSVLDRLGEARREEQLPRILVDLAKSLIMVRYQRARDQVSAELASALEAIVNGVLDRASRSQGEISSIARRARTLLDSLAVLVYQVGRK